MLLALVQSPGRRERHYSVHHSRWPCPAATYLVLPLTRRAALMEREWEQDMSWRITVANCVSAKVMRFLLQLLEAPAHGPGGKVRAARLLTQAHLAGRGCAAGAWLLRRWLVSSQPIPFWSTLQTPPLSATPVL